MGAEVDAGGRRARHLKYGPPPRVGEDVESAKDGIEQPSHPAVPSSPHLAFGFSRSVLLSHAPELGLRSSGTMAPCDTFC
ncbi:hypothetical protein NL676_035668 [Syzygium grande]|nr:hypothetical protein NL676_035668 [Syzygium grande]